jgi:hypothetical protein
MHAWGQRSRCGWLTLLALALAPLIGAAPAAGEHAVSARQAIAWLNAQRADNGIPAGLAEEAIWDEDCRLHMAWWAKNPNAANPHIETPGTPGYTSGGAFAGENSVLAEGIDWEAGSRFPWGARNPWEEAPIHLMQLLGPELSVSGFAPVCMVTWAGYKRTPPAQPELVTYPGNGTSFIYPSENAIEWPFTPAAFVGLREGATTGPYIYVLGWGTGRGRLTAASLTGPKGAVAIATVDDETKGAKGELGVYLPPGGIIIPKHPLAAATTYTASATFQPNALVPELPSLPPGVEATPITVTPTLLGPGMLISPNESLSHPAPVSLTWSFRTAGAPKPSERSKPSHHRRRTPRRHRRR